MWGDAGSNVQTLTDALWALVQCGSNFFTVGAVLSRYDISSPASFRLNMGSLRRPELAQWQQCVCADALRLRVSPASVIARDQRPEAIQVSSWQPHDPMLGRELWGRRSHASEDDISTAPRSQSIMNSELFRYVFRDTIPLRLLDPRSRDC